MQRTKKAISLVEIEALKAEINKLQDLDDEQKRSLEIAGFTWFVIGTSGRGRPGRKYFAYRTIVLTAAC